MMESGENGCFITSCYIRNLIRGECEMNRNLAREKAQALVNQMTVEEAASQLRYDAPAIERLKPSTPLIS